jgi:predicted amidophosphoribosyltransferase
MRTEAPLGFEVPFVPAREGADATLFTCGLCGARFTHGGQVCGGCVLRAGCDVVRCPNCGYQFPRESRIAAWLGRLWGREEER